MYGIMKYFMEIGEFNQPVEYQDQSSMYQAEWNRLNQIYIIDHFLKKFKVSIDEDEDSSDEEFDRIRKTAFMKRRIMRKERIMKLRKRELARDKLVVQISRHWRHCVFLSRVSLKVKEKKLDKRFFDKISNHESRLDDLSNKMKDIGFSEKENSVKTKKNGKIFFN
ncbi:unnamed protein product [Lepeophtheirus salmonis]|uniref:(salmon louse) hypothetical protein n=1 Tax=Lepeophtheirus salmonis TaxID=72036 RepID=A0A7R8CNQ8_LEPSM|nr:unnamed protein product [Lepeophtheirus salmonis]CAF2875243.1 unnamed protein product [Lepeophtheirus salmonis]